MESLINNLEIYLTASVFLSLAAAFLGGVAASFTPCVYPMVPITARYVVSGNLGGSKGRGFVLSLFYVTGISVTYASLGIFAALTGRLFGHINTNPLAYFIVANIIIILGLGMLDVFPIPVIGAKDSAKKSGIVGAFLVGIASGFVAAPCTAPVLGVLLAYVASTQDVLLGASLLFVFAFGLGTLLILVGTFSGVLASLPKSGEWMVKIKKIMGIFMIGMGEYFLIKMGELLL
jgi:thiol:disulfide interchange protein DsbD